jgi:hypothetical protein
VEIVFISSATIVIGLMYLSFFLSKALADAERTSLALSKKPGTHTFADLAGSLNKIIFNHCQMIGLATNLPLRWPPAVEAFFPYLSICEQPRRFCLQSSVLSIGQGGRACKPFAPHIPLFDTNHAVAVTPPPARPASRRLLAGYDPLAVHCELRAKGLTMPLADLLREKACP